MVPFGEESDGFPDPSPDGTSIAFTRIDRSAERVYVGRAGGGAAKLLAESPGALPKWSPDGKRIVFAGNRGYYGGIFVVNADGSDLHRVSEFGGWPVWWPDGMKIGFVVIGRNGDQEIHTIPVDGGSPRAITGLAFNGSNHPFDVSPDGKTLVTTNAVHVSDEIWLLEPRQRK